jgi:hypothetical protein
MPTFLVQDVWEDAKKIFGSCEVAALYRRLTEGVEVLANAGDFDPLIGFLDICTNGRFVALPREVDVPLAINIGGNPSIARDKIFRFHLNGMGDCRTPCGWEWDDLLTFPTLRDIGSPSKVVAWVDHEEDANSLFRIYGFDEQQSPLRSQENGTWVNGYQVPTVFGFALPDTNAPTVSRITKIVRDATTGPVRLATFDLGATTGTVIGVYHHDETVPEYRRIRLSRSCGWIRLMFRKRLLKLAVQDDVIPVPSRIGYLMILRALKAYDEGDIALGTSYEATARRYVVEAQVSHAPPGVMPVQVNDRGNSIMASGDWLE